MKTCAMYAKSSKILILPKSIVTCFEMGERTLADFVYGRQYDDVQLRNECESIPSSIHQEEQGQGTGLHHLLTLLVQNIVHVMMQLEKIQIHRSSNQI